MKNNSWCSFLLTTVLCVMISCSAKKNAEQIPDGIIPFDSMVAVMADIHIAEANAFRINNPDSSAKAKLSSHYKFVFEKHHINSVRFTESFSYYKENVALMNDLYDKVMDELSKRQAEVEK